MSNLGIPIVTVKQFTEIVKMQLDEGNTRPIFGLGKGGIGKSESIQNLAVNELGIGFIDVRLLLYSEVDLKGIPYPDKEHNFTVWLQNNILPRVERDGEKGILVLDEITSCDKSIRTAAYQLLNERRLGEYKLPDGWLIVCLGNGEDDGGDFQGMEGNFANRCSVYEVTYDLDTWKEWGYKSGINALVLAYVTWAPKDLHTYDPDKENEILFASPRSWKAVSDILNTYGFSENVPNLSLRINGNLGTYVGNRFFAFCKFKEANVNPGDIVLGNVNRSPEKLEILFITIQGVIKILRDCIEKDLKCNGELTKQTIVYISNSIKWFLKLDKLEYRISAIKDLIAVNKNVIVKLMTQNTEFKTLCPELLQFAGENKEVFRR
ncbi:MAG: hypothetical protein J6A59_09875 [Lachnospiraceae bacterium]|nr:hypothetical protein [Lachnospiraceae bacterium]